MSGGSFNYAYRSATGTFDDRYHWLDDIHQIELYLRSIDKIKAADEVKAYLDRINGHINATMMKVIVLAAF